MTRQKQNRDFLNIISVNGQSLTSPDLEGVWLDESTILIPSPYGTLTLTVRKANKRGLEKAMRAANAPTPTTNKALSAKLEPQEPQGQSEQEEQEPQEVDQEPEVSLAPVPESNQDEDPSFEEENQELEEVVEEDEEDEEDEFSLLEAQILGRPAPTPTVEQEQDEFYDL